MPTIPPSPYSPDDASISLPTLDFLHSPPGHTLLSQIRTLLESTPDPSVADIAHFRKLHPPEIVHAAFALARAQKKAVGPQGKFPHLPFLYCVPEALEQATDAAVANHKANRFAQLPNLTHILDFCSGIGGDTLSLANIAPTTAIDLSPLRLACLRYNIEIAPPLFPIETRCEDIQSVFLHHPNSYNSYRSGEEIANDPHTLGTLPPTSAFHIDPSRRSNGNRSPKYADLIPGPDLLRKLIHHFPAGAIKLSPAVDFTTLPAGNAIHLELISHHRTVVQSVLYTGTLASHFPPNTRTATALSDAHPPFSLTARPTFPLVSPTIDQYLFETDGAFTRAALAAQLADSLNLRPLTPDAGYLTGPNPLHHPALTPFKILTTLPFSPDRVADALTRLPSETPGSIEVKTRGRLPGIDTDHLQKLWAKRSPHPYTILLFQHQSHVTAAITTRIQQ